MIIRSVGPVPYIISDELYNITSGGGSYHYTTTIPAYSIAAVQNAFAELLTRYPAIMQDAITSASLSWPIVAGWDTPILNNTTWAGVLIAARGAGLCTTVAGTVPVGGETVTFPDNSTGTLTGDTTSTTVRSALAITSNIDLYRTESYTTIPSATYYLPDLQITVLPESVIVNEQIDVAGITSPVKQLLFRGYYRASYLQVTTELRVVDRNVAISTLTKLNGAPITNLTDDPYLNILDQPSTTGGGHGTGDFSTDTIAESDAPTITAIDSGFISVYSPSLAQLNALAGYMWTSSFETNLKKLFGDNAMGTIIGLGVVPVTPPIGGSRNVVLGNVDTGVPMPVVTGQYVKVDCGSITLLPKYDAFLDYEPYTGVDLFLPYIGTVQLSVNDVMGKTIKIVYIVDVISGACVAEILCNGSVYYTFNGCCLTQFPVTNNDYSNVFHSAIQAAISLSSAIAGAFGGSVGSVVSGVAGAANSAINAHPVVNRSGSVAGSCGAMGVQVPYLIMSVPKMVDANAQNAYIGYPNFTTVSLSSISGYTEVENINVTGLHATQEEQDEIKRLLKEGVIL